MTDSMKIAPPGEFSFLPEDWPKYKSRFLRYMNLTDQNLCSDEEKIDCLLYCMGDKAEDIIIQFGKSYSYQELLASFDDFFSPKKNVIYERYKFNSRNQKEGERFDEFLTDIHRLAEHCEYGALKDELIRDKIVIGIRDKNTSDRMLLKSDLTLKDATLLCRQAEIQQEESKIFRKEEDIEVNRMKRDIRQSSKCWFCGLERHQRNLCPASKATCHKCQRVGHFARLCRSKSMRRMEEQKEPELAFEEGGDPFPRIAKVLQYSDQADYLDAWYGMEGLVAKGLAKSIGVSNFNSEQISRIVEKGKIKPVINQVECHPYLTQQRLGQFCADRNITLMCYGVLGSVGTPKEYRANTTPVLEDPLVNVMAAGLGVSPAQLLISYQIQSGHPVVTKASSAARLWDCLQSIKLPLNDTEIEALNSLNKNKRTFDFKEMGETHRNYPFKTAF